MQPEARQVRFLYKHITTLMNCRIELQAGELRRVSPNFDYLTTLLGTLAPDDLAGTVSVIAAVSGVRLEFTGAKEWSGQSLSAEIIPRWMFAEAAFRELIARRVHEFVELLENLTPNVEAGEENDFGFPGEWALGS